MTSLGLSEGAGVPDRWLARVNWAVVVPWLVAVLIAGTGGYHRFLTVEASRTEDAAELRQLRRDVQHLTEQVSVLTAIVERMEQRVDRAQERPVVSPRSRMFDR